MYRSHFPAALLLMALSLPVSSVNAEETVLLEYEGTPLEQVIHGIAESLRECFLLPTGAERAAFVAARVDFVGEVPHSLLLAMCRSICAEHGFDIVERGDATLPIHWVVPGSGRAASHGQSRVAPDASTPSSGTEETVPMDFYELDFKVVLDAIAEFSQERIAYRGSDIESAKIFFRAPVPVPLDRMLLVFSAMLEQAGLTTVSVGNADFHILEIVPIEDLADLEGETAPLRVAVLGREMLGAAEGTAAAAEASQTVKPAPAGYAETRNIGPDEWELSADAVRDLRDNYASYLDETTLRAYYDQRTRKLQGLQVRARVADPRFTSFGIVNRDVITEIQGSPVNAVQDIVDAISQSPDAATVVFGILRNGEPRQLTYHLHPEGGAPVARHPRRLRSQTEDPLGWRRASAPEPARALPMDIAGVDLGVLLDAISELTGTAFIRGDGVDRSVRIDVKLFFRCPGPVPEDRVLLALQCVLEVNGLTLAPVRGVAAGQVFSIEALPWFAESRQRRTPVAPEFPRNPEPPAPTDPPESQDTSGSPGTISFTAPEGCDVGATYQIPIYVDAGDRYLAAYGIELRWDNSVLAIEDVTGGGGSFDPPFVINLENEKGQLRFNGITIRPGAAGKVPVAVLTVRVLARPISGPAIIGPLSTNQTVAVYADDGTTPIIVPEPRLEPLELRIR